MYFFSSKLISKEEVLNEYLFDECVDDFIFAKNQMSCGHLPCSVCDS